ncbi:MAG TPA: CoA transferase [Acidimicrobiales bacterium]|nr:CoA transferase [Acidimicrobiales bacterium]
MNRADVDRAVALAGLTLPADADFEVVGSDPLLPSPHHLGEGAAVARLLTGLAAAELWRLRTGHAQRVTVDAAHAAASLTSFAHVRYHDETKRPTLDRAGINARLGRIFATRDGRHIQLHPSFQDGPKLLDVLGLDDTATSEHVDDAVARRDGFELEAELVERRMCGGVVLTKDEWATHPQGQAIDGLPVVSITRIADAPVEQLREGPRPLSGVRVLDLTRVLAGPTCAKTLAEHGADVLHVTAPGFERNGPFEVETGIGKRQAHLDLRDEADAARLHELLAGADVFSQGYRLGALARKGLSPEQLAAIRPGIVYVSENCYGHVGPWAERPGWEQLGQAATGMSHREGRATPAGTPQLAPAAVNDYTTGFFAAYGALTALAKRATEGGSWHVQVSLSQTSTWYQSLGDDVDPAASSSIDVTPFLDGMDTPAVGRISYLRPAVTMSKTPPRWDLPPAPHGTHDAVWAG